MEALVADMVVFVQAEMAAAVVEEREPDIRIVAVSAAVVAVVAVDTQVVVSDMVLAVVSSPTAAVAEASRVEPTAEDILVVVDIAEDSPRLSVVSTMAQAAGTAVDNPKVVNTLVVKNHLRPIRIH